MPPLKLLFNYFLQLMLDTWNQSIFYDIKQRLQDSAMKLVHAERNGEAFDSQLVIGVRESYGNSFYATESILAVALAFNKNVLWTEAMSHSTVLTLGCSRRQNSFEFSISFSLSTKILFLIVVTSNRKFRHLVSSSCKPSDTRGVQ